MNNTNFTTTERSFKHLTDIHRGRLEEMARQGTYTQAEMAQELNVSQSTISRELKRGRTRQMASNRTYYDRYLADSGARVYHENRQSCHAKDFHKYSEGFFKELPKAIISTKKQPREHSIDTFVHTYRKDHPDEHVPCTKTVYTLIGQGVLSIRNIDLPMKTRMRPRKKQPSEPKGKNTKHLGRSIEERDASVLSREETGHWEVDLVIGKKTKGEPVILTMVERKSRFLLTKKIWGKDAETVQAATLQLMKKHGLEDFKSLTTDNGSEFSTLSLIEEKEPAVQVFFTHAFASWEKGTNERHNGLLREFIPKGESLRTLTYSDLQMYTDAINNRPRKILGYQTPEQCIDRELHSVA
ncbi:IS30 family transposase [Cytobacillus sp. S13-E01]|uniref:IS30 family transposase n=2 Tax=Cytobacillus sp. S13-E01 TaxID=3031326 RepID=UPI0023D7EB0E|nr:IS30 family transposase [Cytobacillus sp. S13-E01]MDF0728511.1 IS30 family transposase [Cytobacillus sp. S13-E01]